MSEILEKNNLEGEEESSPAGLVKNADIPEGAIPLFQDDYGNTAFIKNIPNPYTPKAAPVETAPIYKSVREHKHITTLQEARAFTKMSHASESFKGSERISLNSIEKSMADGQIGMNGTIHWTKDMGASAAVARDWADFERFRKSGRF